jgi:integrase
VFRSGLVGLKFTTIFTTMKVTIEPYRGLLRLRFDDGKRRCISLGVADSKVGNALALQKKAQIELDWQIGQYDRTLLKYKPRIIGKNPTEISTPELFDRFTKHKAKAKGLAQSGINSRYIALRKMLEKVLDVPANTISNREAERFADVCAESLQADTAKARLSLLVACWDWAKGKYHVAEENPFKGISARFRSQEKKAKSPFSLVEVRAILDGFRSSRYYSHYADYASFLLGVGCRVGEASGLVWGNVASDFTSVYICQSFSRGVMGDTKTKKSRTVNNLSPSIVTMLNRRNEDQQPQASDLVFFTQTGLPINDRNFRRRAWTNVLNAAGVDYRSPYKCRSTAASHSIASGVDYVSVAKALGNSPKVLHDHYLDIIESRSVFIDFD